MAQIIPVSKEEEAEYFSNYRPIPILSIFSKMFE